MKRHLEKGWLVTALLLVLAMLASGCAAAPTPQPVEKVVTVQVTVPVVQTQVVLETREVEKQTVVTATPEPQKPTPEGGKTIIRVGTGDSGEGLNPHQEIISRFEKANPDVLVQLEAVAGADYYTRLLTQIAAKRPPDIMQIGDDAVPMFVDKGALGALDDCLKADPALDTGIYLPGLLQPGQWKGQQWLLPKDYSPMGVYYNKKIFDQFKEPYPKDGWTWDDMLNTAKSLTRDTTGDGKTDIWGIQLPASWTSGFEYWVNSAGGRLISEDGKKFVGYMDSPEVQSALKFYSDLYNVHKVAPPPADLAMFGGGNTEFDQGKAAMRLFGRWPEAGYKTNPNIDLGVVGVPVGKVRANILFWGGFGVAAASENPEAACRFLKFYTGKEGAEVWKDWALPAVKSVADSSGLSKDPIEGVWISELNYLAPRAYVFTPYWGQTADPALRKALETVLITPGVDVAQVLKQAAAEAQAALDEQLAQQ
jgi:multiple sugar transport system substrate-binding protein